MQAWIVENKNGVKYYERNSGGNTIMTVYKTETKANNVARGLNRRYPKQNWLAKEVEIEIKYKNVEESK